MPRQVPVWSSEAAVNVLHGLPAFVELRRVQEATGLKDFEASMQIFVSQPGTPAFTRTVQPSDTVGQLKASIHQRTGLPTERQCLYYGGKPLNDERTLESQRVTKGATIELRQRAAWQGWVHGVGKIFVKYPGQDGMVVKLEVEPLHSIAHVKTLLQNEHGVPADHFRLFMKVDSQAGPKDVMLEETRTLSDYNVKRESMLHLVARLRGEARTKQNLQRVFNGGGR